MVIHWCNQWRRSHGGRGGANAPLDFLRGGVAPPHSKRSYAPLIISVKVRFKASIFAPPLVVWSRRDLRKLSATQDLRKWPTPPQFFDWGTEPPLNLTPGPPSHETVPPPLDVTVMLVHVVKDQSFLWRQLSNGSPIILRSSLLVNRFINKLTIGVCKQQVFNVN